MCALIEMKLCDREDRFINDSININVGYQSENNVSQVKQTISKCCRCFWERQR